MLILVFDQRDVSTETELVATGSRVFDSMLTYLERCGALTLQQLPILFGGGEELMQAIRPVNASIIKLNMQEQQNLYLFNWRITYRADDKREELYTVVLDESGTRLSISDDNPMIDDGPLTNSSLTATDVPGRSERRKISNDSINLSQLVADAQPVPIEMSEEGQPLLPKLPPMTHLVRLAETARKYAIYHADVQCVDIEAELQPRLYKMLNRLHSYYSQQIEEVYDAHDPSGDKRVALENDLERKLVEEVENHRLRVQLDLFSYAIFQVPVAVADLVLNDGTQETSVHVRQNRYTGTLRRPQCHSCHQEISDVVVDRHGHITCNDCLCQCSNCLELLCQSCGVDACPFCDQSNCATCSESCWACGEKACLTHISDCPVCFDPVCHACQATCIYCGTRQCHTHLRVDCVKPKTSPSISNTTGVNINGDRIHTNKDDSIHLICAECAVRCPGCQQYSAQTDTCETSGQRFCRNCLAICTSCTKQVGPGYYHISPVDAQPYCKECLLACPSCEAPVSEIIVCNICRDECCAQCSDVCTLCRQRCCNDHTHRDATCGHKLCADHIAHCGVGGESVCPTCHEPCAICERYYCGAHMSACALCRCRFCTECVRSKTGLCDTCATIPKEGVRVYMPDEPIAAHRDVYPLAHSYEWTRAQNSHYRIYLGKGPFNSGAFVLTRLTEEGPDVMIARKIPILDIIWRWD
ncbi:hypothetical protein KFU94_45395 [Chloroflexi bacterium TSY]|nr:hypothetical protein [Chloroflexi bacterium TSY]